MSVRIFIPGISKEASKDAWSSFVIIGTVDMFFFYVILVNDVTYIM